MPSGCMDLDTLFPTVWIFLPAVLRAFVPLFKVPVVLDKPLTIASLTGFFVSTPFTAVSIFPTILSRESAPLEILVVTSLIFLGKEPIVFNTSIYEIVSILQTSIHFYLICLNVYLGTSIYCHRCISFLVMHG